MRKMAICFLAAVLTACSNPSVTAIGATSGNSPIYMPVPAETASFAPRPSDGRLELGKVFITTARIVSSGSQPIQARLILRGDLPTPCHELRVQVDPADSAGRITISAYSVVDRRRICIEMLQPFESEIPLGALPAGHYTVWINGERLAEFDL